MQLSLQAELALDYFELRSADAQRRLLDDAVDAFSEACSSPPIVSRAAPRRSRTSRKPRRSWGPRACRQPTSPCNARVTSTRSRRWSAKPPAALSLPVAPLADGAAGDSARAAVAAARAASGHRFCGAARRRGERARRDRAHIFLPDADPQCGRRLRRQLDRELVDVAEPVLGDRSDRGTDAARWRQASRDLGSGRRAYDAAVADYRQATLTAFQQVEDNLAALRMLEQEAQQQAATTSAQESLRISTDRYLGGADPYLQVLTAQTIALANERNDVDIMRRRMAASVLLIKSLGGGWTAAQLPSLSAGPDRFQ